MEKQLFDQFRSVCFCALTTFEDNDPTLEKYLIKKQKTISPLIHVISSFSTVALLFRVTAALPAPAAVRRPTRTRHFGQTTISDIVPGSGQSLFGPVIGPRVLAVAVDAAVGAEEKVDPTSCVWLSAHRGASVSQWLSLSDVSLPLFFCWKGHTSSQWGHISHTHTHSSEFFPISSVNLFIPVLPFPPDLIWSDLIFKNCCRVTTVSKIVHPSAHCAPIVLFVESSRPGSGYISWRSSSCLFKIRCNLSWFSRNGNKQDEVEMTVEKQTETAFDLLPEMLFQICRRLSFSWL